MNAGLIGFSLVTATVLAFVGGNAIKKVFDKVLKETQEAERLAAEQAKKKLKNTPHENKIDSFIREQEQRLEKRNQERRQEQVQRRAEEAKQKLEEAKKQQEEFLRQEKERQYAEFEKVRQEAEKRANEVRIRREAEARAEAQRRADEARKQSSNSYGQGSSRQNHQTNGNNGSRYGGNHSQGTDGASGSPPPPKTAWELRDEKIRQLGSRKAGKPSKEVLLNLLNEIAKKHIAEINKKIEKANSKLPEDQAEELVQLVSLNSTDREIRRLLNKTMLEHNFEQSKSEEVQTEARTLGSILALLKKHHIK
jgi:hypothetical protein